MDKTKTKPIPTEYELRDDILAQTELVSGLAHTDNGFRRYEDGVWVDVHDLKIKQIVGSHLEAIQYNYAVNLSHHTENNLTNALRSLTYKEPSVWDTNSNILVFENVTYDVSTGKERDHSKEDMATVRIPYAFDRTARADTWLMVLDDLLGEDERKFFQEFAGYCLTTSTKYQMALWLTGPRGGGKSTLITGLETMLGHLSGHLSISQLSSDFGLSNIVGKTLLTCSETPKDHVKQTDVINALVTGDTITVNQKYKNKIEHRNTAKLLWSMNTLPNLFDANNGLFRRVKILEMAKAIPEHERKPEIIENIRGEGAGIINWALDGLARLNEHGKFEYPKSVLAATDGYRAENDLTAQFLDEVCERAPEHLFWSDEYKVYAQSLTKAFNEWAEGSMPRSMMYLAKEWHRHGLRRNIMPNGKPKKDRNGVAWYGVRFVA